MNIVSCQASSCVCVSARVRACMHTDVHVHKYTYTYTLTVYTYMHTHTHIYAYNHRRTDYQLQNKKPHTYIHTYIHTYTHTHTAYIQTTYTYTYTHTHTHTHTFTEELTTNSKTRNHSTGETQDPNTHTRLPPSSSATMSGHSTKVFSKQGRHQNSSSQEKDASAQYVFEPRTNTNNSERERVFEDVLASFGRLGNNNVADVAGSYHERTGSAHAHMFTTASSSSSKGSVSGYNIVSSAPREPNAAQRMQSRYENAQRSHNTHGTNLSRLEHVLNASRFPSRDLAGSIYEHAAESEQEHSGGYFRNSTYNMGAEECDEMPQGVGRLSHAPRMKTMRSSRMSAYDRLQAGDFDFGGEEDCPGYVSVSTRVQEHPDGGYNLPGYSYSEMEHYGLLGYQGTCESTLGGSGHGNFRERVMNGASAASRCAAMLERMVRCVCVCVRVCFVCVCTCVCERE
jgi:hypothetical protein